jgi:WD40 repeat protein
MVSVQFTSDEATVKVWDVAAGATLFTKSLGPVFFSGRTAMSHDGRLVAVATGGDPTSQGGASGLRQTPLQVTVLDAETGAVVAEITLDTFTGNNLGVDFGNVEPLLAIGDPSGITIMSTETFDVVRRIDYAGGAEFGVHFRDADTDVFAQGGFDAILRFDVSSEGAGSIALPVAGITSLSPVGDAIAVVELDGSLSFWSARSGEHLGTADLAISGTAELVSSHDRISGIGGVPMFSADGALLYVRDDEGHISVVEVSSGAIVGRLDLPVGRTHNALAVSASGSFIATGHSDGRVMLWDAASFGDTDEPIGEWQLFDRVGDCDLATDPTFDGIRRLNIREAGPVLQLRVVDQCGAATAWEIVDGQATSTATFTNSFTTDFGPGGLHLTSQLGTRLGLLADDGAEIQTFEAHNEDILQTSTSLDLGTMASVSRDLIGLWYTRSGEFLASGITGAQAHIAGDGSFAVTSGGAGFDWFGGPVVVWDLDPDTWEEQACLAAGRNFTLFEWQQFFPDDVYRVTCPQWPSGLAG